MQILKVVSVLKRKSIRYENGYESDNLRLTCLFILINFVITILLLKNPKRGTNNKQIN